MTTPKRGKYVPVDLGPAAYEVEPPKLTARSLDDLLLAEMQRQGVRPFASTIDLLADRMEDDEISPTDENVRAIVEDWRRTHGGK